MALMFGPVPSSRQPWCVTVRSNIRPHFAARKLLVMKVLAMTLLACASAGVAAADDYPCGPGGLPLFLRRLVPQEAFGADFRPACRAHDSCYTSTGRSRKDCDKQFRSAMHSACANSDRPILCRMAANHRYRVVRLFGGGPFRRSR